MIHLYNKIPSKLSTIMITFDAGARAEGTKYSQGLAHMLEHMIFKGTEKRNYLDIPREISFLGGQTNAFTSQEEVAFHITVPYQNLEGAMDILSDMIHNPLFPSEEFIKEREVVKEEEKSSNDRVQSVIYKEFCRRYFGHRIAEPIIGSQESISGFTLEELRAFYDEFYQAKNTIVALSSRHSKRDARALLNKYFGKPTGKVIHPVPIYTPEYQDAREIRITRPELEHTYVWMCYPGNKIQNQGEATEMILQNIFGSGMDSRLFTEVREERGLVYGISASMSSFRDYSSMIVGFSTRPENVEEAIAVVTAEVSKIKNSAVTDEELERAKNKYRSSSYSILESGFSLARHSTARIFYGLNSLEERDADVDLVSKEGIQSMSQKIFDESKLLTLICESEDVGNE